MKTSPRLFLPLMLVALMPSFSGCQSPAKTAEAKPEEEYVYVMVTGSNIPKKIKKSDIAAGTVAKDVDMQLMDKEALAKSARGGALKGN